MAENADFPNQFDPNIPSENIAYAPDELIACKGCSRSNPPNRLDCLYCGAPLDLTLDMAADLKVPLQQLEAWQRGWNLIGLPTGKPVGLDLLQIASVLSLDPQELGSMLGASVPLPIARVDTEQKAEVLAAKLHGFDVECRIFGDAVLNAEKPPTRIKRVDFIESAIDLKDFNTGEVKRLRSRDIELIVIGRLVTSRTDILEKRRRKGQADIIDATATGSDEIVIDLYERGEATGYRIRTAGFDYSGLGERMSILAPENVRTLIGRFKAVGPDIIINDSYNNVRPLLEAAWPTETRNDTLGIHRTGLGKRGFGSVASTSNSLQFTKFSRLQYLLRTL